MFTVAGWDLPKKTILFKSGNGERQAPENFQFISLLWESLTQLL
jgi:hypothetical protein